jgi:hypothetical protein
MAGGRKTSRRNVDLTTGDHSIGRGSKEKSNLKNIEQKELTVIEQKKIELRRRTWRKHKSSSEESMTSPKASREGRKSKKGYKCGHCKDHHPSKEDVKSCPQKKSSKESMASPKESREGRKSKKGYKCGHCKDHHPSKEDVKSCPQRN